MEPVSWHLRQTITTGSICTNFSVGIQIINFRGWTSLSRLLYHHLIEISIERKSSAGQVSTCLRQTLLLLNWIYSRLSLIAHRLSLGYWLIGSLVRELNHNNNINSLCLIETTPKVRLIGLIMPWMDVTRLSGVYCIRLESTNPLIVVTSRRVLSTQFELAESTHFLEWVEWNDHSKMNELMKEIWMSWRQNMSCFTNTKWVYTTLLREADKPPIWTKV